MTPLQQLEQKIRQSIPELKEEYEAFEDSSIDRDMITPIMLNHVIIYLGILNTPFRIRKSTDPFVLIFRHLLNGDGSWNLKSAYLKDQSEELITFLNELK